MGEDTIGFKRGQVWHKQINEQQIEENTENPHLLKKSRPYLIVSDENENLTSSTIICIPVKTVHNDSIFKGDVEFTFRERKQIVRCSEFHTFDKSSFNNEESGYMYTLSDDIMEKVDLELIIQLRLLKKALSLDNLYIVIDKIIQERQEELNKKYTHVNMNIFGKIASKIDSIFEMNNNEAVMNIFEENNNIFLPDLKNDCPINENNDNKVIDKLKENKKKEIKKNNSINKIEHKLMSNEEKQQFLSDYNHFSVKEMMEKYQIKTKSALYSKKYIIAKQLKK